MPSSIDMSMPFSVARTRGRRGRRARRRDMLALVVVVRGTAGWKGNGIGGIEEAGNQHTPDADDRRADSPQFLLVSGLALSALLGVGEGDVARSFRETAVIPMKILPHRSQSARSDSRATAIIAQRDADWQRVARTGSRRRVSSSQGRAFGQLIRNRRCAVAGATAAYSTILVNPWTPVSRNGSESTTVYSLATATRQANLPS